MPIFRRLLWTAAAKLASNPDLRAKAAGLAEREVKPRAQGAWRRAKPALEGARQDLREAAAEANPRDKPAEFAGRVAGRLRARARRG